MVIFSKFCVGSKLYAKVLIFKNVAEIGLGQSPFNFPNENYTTLNFDFFGRGTKNFASN